MKDEKDEKFMIKISFKTPIKSAVLFPPFPLMATFLFLKIRSAESQVNSKLQRREPADRGIGNTAH